MASSETKRPDLLQERHPVFGWALVLPAIAGLALFQFLPLINAIIDSFRSFGAFDGVANGWTGIDNYTAVFSDPIFRASLVNTFGYIALTLGIEIPLALALAVLIDRRLPGTAWARSAVIGALAASEVVTATIWTQMYEPSTGLFNAVLMAVGLPAQPFTNGDSEALLSIVVMSVWKDVGLPMLVFYAGLQAIPRELRDAAALDGANAWQSFWNVVLPMLRPSLVVAIFMTTIAATRTFTPIIVMTQGGPHWGTANLTYYAFSQSFEFSSPGLAAAGVVCLLVLLVATTLAQARLLRPGRGG